MEPRANSLAYFAFASVTKKISYINIKLGSCPEAFQVTSVETPSSGQGWDRDEESAWRVEESARFRGKAVRRSGKEKVGTWEGQLERRAGAYLIKRLLDVAVTPDI